ncbi:hypothetical protein RUND412_002551 [Rhizina undulata]
MTSEPFECRWGILATGLIAQAFTKDLLVDPSTRGTTDIQHIVQAAAANSSAERARKFLEAVGAPSTATAYGSYEELVADPNIDIIYIATPHSHHFQHCLLALKAGKNIVCEKPFTINSEQTKIIVKIAREKKLFLMEAVWTRFFPLCKEIIEHVNSGRIGDVRRVFSDLSMAQNPEEEYKDGTHRMVNPDLGGGVLLDLGIYSLTWVYQILYHALPDAEKRAPVITGAISKYAPTGVDDENVVICSFPNSIGIATSSIQVATDPDESGHPAVRIQGTNGEIQVNYPAYRPTSYTIIGKGKGATVEKKDIPIPEGHGFHWEADGAARCLRDGKLESEVIPLDESILVMEAMDKIREIAGFKYPEGLESVSF